MKARFIRQASLGLLIAALAAHGAVAANSSPGGNHSGNAATLPPANVASSGPIHVAGAGPSTPAPQVKPIRGRGMCYSNCIRGMGTDFVPFCKVSCR
jgi:hypothetical protein